MVPGEHGGLASQGQVGGTRLWCLTQQSLGARLLPGEFHEGALHWFLKNEAESCEFSRACFPEGSEHTVLFLRNISLERSLCLY